MLVKCSLDHRGRSESTLRSEATFLLRLLVSFVDIKIILYSFQVLNITLSSSPLSGSTWRGTLSSSSRVDPIYFQRLTTFLSDVISMRENMLLIQRGSRGDDKCHYERWLKGSSKEWIDSNSLRKQKSDADCRFQISLRGGQLCSGL